MTAPKQNKVQVNVYWNYGGITASTSFAEFLMKLLLKADPLGFEPGSISTNGGRTEWKFKTSQPAKALQAIDEEIMTGRFGSVDPESWNKHDPFSVRYQVMPLGMGASSSLTADVVNYLSEKSTVLMGELLNTQSRVHQLEQIVQQAQQVNLHQHGLKYLPDIVKHVNEQLASIGCDQYEIPKIVKH